MPTQCTNAIDLAYRPESYFWAKDSNNAQTGACTGDSGGPFLSQTGKLVGITVWSQGSANKACGELTQALRLDAARDFIEATLRQWSR